MKVYVVRRNLKDVTKHFYTRQDSINILGMKSIARL